MKTEKNDVAVNNAAPNEYAPNGLSGVNSNDVATVNNTVAPTDTTANKPANTGLKLKTDKDGRKYVDVGDIGTVSGAQQQAYKDFSSSVGNVYNMPAEEPVVKEEGQDSTALNNGEDPYSKLRLTDAARGTLEAMPGGLEDYKALNQKWWQRIINGTIRGLTIAGTSYAEFWGNIASMAALPVTAGDRIKNLRNKYEDMLDSDEWHDKSVTQKAWDVFNVAISPLSDSPINKLGDWINNKVTELTPIYRTSEQQQLPWYHPDNLFSSAFLGEDIISNLGFVIGTGASMKHFGKLTGKIAKLGQLGKRFKGISGALMDEKGQEAYAKAMNAIIKGTDVATGEKLVDEVIKIGLALNKKSARVARISELMAAFGEASIEATSNTEEWYNLQHSLLEDRVGEKFSDENIMQQIINMHNDDGVQLYKTVTDPKSGETNYELTESGEDLFSQMKQQGDDDMRRGEAKLAMERAKMANNILLWETLLLTATNKFSFDYMLRGGYSAEKMVFDAAKSASRGARGVAIQKNLNRMTKAMMDDLKKANRRSNIRGWANAFLDPFVQGFEEIEQKHISESAGIKGAAALSQYMGYTIDPETNQQATNFFMSALQSFDDVYGDLDSWQEFFVGALTSVVGLPGMVASRDHEGKLIYETDEKTGKPKLKRHLALQGNIWDHRRESKYQRQRSQEIIDELNNIVSSDDFTRKLGHFLRGNAIEEMKEKALKEGNVFAYKNGEAAQFVNFVTAFYRAGRMNDLYDMLDAVAASPASEIRDVTTDEDGNGSPWRNLPDAEVKTRIQERVKSVKEDLDRFVKIRKSLEDTYGADADDKFLDTMTWGLYTYDDAGNRLNEITNKIKLPLTRLVNKLNEILPEDKKLASEKGIILDLVEFLQNDKNGAAALEKLMDSEFMGDAVKSEKERTEFINYLNTWLKRNSKNASADEVKKAQDALQHATEVQEAFREHREFTPGEVFDLERDMVDAFTLAEYRRYVAEGIIYLAKSKGGFDTGLYAQIEEARKLHMTNKTNESMAAINDPGKANTREKFVNLLRGLRESEVYEDVLNRIRNGSNQKQKLWLKDMELTDAASGELFARLERYVEDSAPSNEIGNMMTEYINYLKYTHEHNGIMTFDGMYDMVDAITSMVFNFDGGHVTLFSDKNKQDFIEIIDRWKSDIEYQQLVEGTLQAENKPEEVKMDDNTNDEGNGPKTSENGQETGPTNPVPTPNNPTPQNPSDSGGGGAATSVVTAEAKAMYQTAETDPLVGRTKIDDTRSRLNSLSPDELAKVHEALASIAKPIIEKTQTPRDIANSMAAAAQDAGANLGYTTYIGYVNKAVSLFRDVEKKIADSKAAAGAVKASEKEKREPTSDEALAKETDIIAPYMDGLLEMSREDLIRQQTALQAGNTLIIDGKKVTISEESRQLALKEVNRLLEENKESVSPITDPVDAGQLDSALNDLRQKMNAVERDVMNSQENKPQTTVIRGKEVNLTSHDPVDYLPGLAVTDVHIGELIDGNLVTYDAKEKGEGLAALQDKLTSLKVYDFVNSGALGAYHNYNRAKNNGNTNVFFLASPNDTVLKGQQTQEGKSGDVYNIMLAIEIDSESRQILKPYEDAGKTNYITVDGKTYQIIGFASKGARYEEQNNAYDTIFNRVVTKSAIPESQSNPGQQFYLGKENGNPIHTVISEVYSGRMCTAKDGNAPGFRPLNEVIGNSHSVGQHYIGLILPGESGVGVRFVTNAGRITSDMTPVRNAVEPLLNDKFAGTMWLLTRDAAGNFSYSYLTVPTLAEYNKKGADDSRNAWSRLIESQDKKFVRDLLTAMSNVFNNNDIFHRRRAALQEVMSKIYIPKGYKIKLDSHPNEQGSVGLTIEYNDQSTRVASIADFYNKLAEDGLGFKIDKAALSDEKLLNQLMESGMIQSDYIDIDHHGANFTIKFLPETGNTIQPVAPAQKAVTRGKVDTHEGQGTRSEPTFPAGMTTMNGLRTNLMTATDRVIAIEGENIDETTNKAIDAITDVINGKAKFVGIDEGENGAKKLIIYQLQDGTGVVIGTNKLIRSEDGNSVMAVGEEAQVAMLSKEELDAIATILKDKGTRKDVKKIIDNHDKSDQSAQGAEAKSPEAASPTITNSNVLVMDDRIIGTAEMPPTLSRKINAAIQMAEDDVSTATTESGIAEAMKHQSILEHYRDLLSDNAILGDKEHMSLYKLSDKRAVIVYYDGISGKVVCQTISDPKYDENGKLIDLDFMYTGKPQILDANYVMENKNARYNKDAYPALAEMMKLDKKETKAPETKAPEAASQTNIPEGMISLEEKLRRTIDVYQDDDPDCTEAINNILEGRATMLGVMEISEDDIKNHPALRHVQKQIVAFNTSYGILILETDKIVLDNNGKLIAVSPDSFINLFGGYGGEVLDDLKAADADHKRAAGRVPQQVPQDSKRGTIVGGDESFDSMVGGKFTYDESNTKGLIADIFRESEDPDTQAMADDPGMINWTFNQFIAKTKAEDFHPTNEQNLKDRLKEFIDCGR